MCPAYALATQLAYRIRSANPWDEPNLTKTSLYLVPIEDTPLYTVVDNFL